LKDVSLRNAQTVVIHYGMAAESWSCIGAILDYVIYHNYDCYQHVTPSKA